ncbi:MAG: hypothetical protein ACRD44_09045 [Bryobacteraceae bacterium]
MTNSGGVGTQDTATTGYFRPHPNLSDEINDNICQSEIEGGVNLDHLPVGIVLEFETRNRFYTLENCGSGRGLITGHPEYCPEPVMVDLHGSTWGRSMIKLHFLGRGMHLEFRHAEHGVIRTSQISEIRQLREPWQLTRQVQSSAASRNLA